MSDELLRVGYRDRAWLALSAVRDVVWLSAVFFLGLTATSQWGSFTEVKAAGYLGVISILVVLRLRCSIKLLDEQLIIQNPVRRISVNRYDIAHFKRAEGIASFDATRLVFYDGARRRSVRVAAVRGDDVDILGRAVRTRQGPKWG